MNLQQQISDVEKQADQAVDDANQDAQQAERTAQKAERDAQQLMGGATGPINGSDRATKKGSKTRLATGGPACEGLISCALVEAAAASSASVDTRMAMSVRDSVEAPFDMVTYPSTARRAARPVGSLNVPQPAVVRNAGATPAEA